MKVSAKALRWQARKARSRRHGACGRGSARGLLPAALRRALPERRPGAARAAQRRRHRADRSPKGSDEARLAVEIRNALIFDFTGGGYAAPPTHRLKIQISSTRSSVIVDINTSRPDIENYGINASYTLTEIATGKEVVTATTFARVSYDIPGQQQRFARVRGLRDAESRAAKVIADNIRARLASYFIAGT